MTCPPVQEDDVHEKTSDGPEKRVQAEGEKDQGLEGKPLGHTAQEAGEAQHSWQGSRV